MPALDRSRWDRAEPRQPAADRLDGAWSPDLSWIQADLAIGGAFPSHRAAELVLRSGIGAVIDVRAERCDDGRLLSACGLEFLHLATPGAAGVSQPLLDLGVDFTRDVARGGCRVLIHSEDGLGRSATLALCCLADRGFEPLAAVTLIKNARALVSPSQAQYRAWATWLDRRGHGPAPSYEDFAMIAYRGCAAGA